MKRSTRYLLGLGAMVGGGLLVWTGHASASHDVRTLHTCVSQQQGMIRVADACRSAENPVVLLQETALTDIEARLAALTSRAADLETDNAALASRVGEVETDNTALTSRVADLQVQHNGVEFKVNDIKALLAGVTRTGDELIFTGMNLNLRNGLGGTGSTNGLGNLIVGYNETSDDTRTGSHNLVVGADHSYSSYGGVVFGANNTIADMYSTVTGGQNNAARHAHASVSGGAYNTASGVASSVSGGFSNTAHGLASSVSGGSHRGAVGNFSWRAGSLVELH